MKKGDYVPRSDSKLYDWVKKILVYIFLHHERWGLLEPPASLKELLEEFEAALLKVLDPYHSSMDVAKKNRLKEALTKAIRTYVQAFLARNPAVNIDDRTYMQLPVYDTTPTTVPAPDMQATADLSFPGPGLVEVRSIRQSTEKPVSKAGYGVRIHYGILSNSQDTGKFRLAQRPKTGEDLPHSVFTRRQRHQFDFDGESGNEIFICLRYENSKGQVGPFGKIITAFIP